MKRTNILTILYKLARKLAKSNKYQFLYSQYKESGVRIFENECNLTSYQITFLQYLAFYSNLQMAVYMDEVSEIVLDNDIYEDAYTYYKQKNRKKEVRARNTPLNKTSSGKPVRTNLDAKSKTHIVFSKPPLKRRS